MIQESWKYEQKARIKCVLIYIMNHNLYAHALTIEFVHKPEEIVIRIEVKRRMYIR